MEKKIQQWEQKNYIDEETGNQIWSNMIRKQRMLPGVLSAIEKPTE